MSWNQDERLDWMKKLGKRTTDQQMIVDLSAKTALNTAERNLLTSLWAADKLRFKAREAERKTAELFGRVAQVERRRQNHAKICLGIAALQMARENEHMKTALLTRVAAVENVDMDAVREVMNVYLVPV